MRTKGSCRFDPYYKVQAFRAESAAWSDVKGVSATEKEARSKAAKEPLPTRIREVTMKGTRIL